jgi:hypothetical protein
MLDTTAKRTGPLRDPVSAHYTYEHWYKYTAFFAGSLRPLWWSGHILHRPNIKIAPVGTV